MFLINAPIVLALLAALPRLVVEHRSERTPRFDALGALLSLVGILLAVYALKHAAEALAWSVTSTVAAALGLGLLAIFLRRQRRIEHPLIDLALFRNPVVVGALLATTFGMFAVLGPNLYIAQYLQLSLRLSALGAALWLLPIAGAGLVGAISASALRSRVGDSWTAAIGFALSTAGLILLSLTPATGGLAPLIGGGFVLGLGVASVATLATERVVSAATPAKAGTASAMSETGSELGGALGIAVIGSMGAAVYRATLGRVEGVPTAALDSYAAAVEIASTAPGGEALYAAAAVAFADGLRVAALIGATLTAALAVSVPLLLRSRGTAEPDATAHTGEPGGREASPEG